jgi:hypothetical protein
MKLPEKQLLNWSGKVEGREIKVAEARPREERSGGNGGGGEKRSFSRNNSYNNRY